MEREEKLKHKRFIVLFLLVLCILGLSMLPHDNNPSATMKDLVVGFTGADSASVSNVVFSDTSGVVSPVAGTTNDYCVPVGTHCVITYNANADLNGWNTTPQSLSYSFNAGNGATAQTISITVNYSMQVALAL